MRNLRFCFFEKSDRVAALSDKKYGFFVETEVEYRFFTIFV